MTYYTGIDIGTGSTKAVSIDARDGKVLFTKQVTYPMLCPAPHSSEQSPALMWEAMATCIIETVAALKEPPRAIGLSSAMHGVIPVDERGEPLMNMMTWADGRSAAIADRIKIMPGADKIYEATGTPIHAMSPLCKITWIRENEPDIFKRTFKFISIKEYIWHKLFGDYEADHSIASCTGLFDILALNWHAPALSLAGIAGHHLSRPVSTGHARQDAIPAIRAALRLGPETSFVIGASDGCLAHLGSQALQPGIASLTIGTSGAIRIAGHAPCHNFRHMTFNYRLDEETFVSGGPINNGGAVWQWYVSCLLQKETAHADEHETLLKKAGRIPPGANGLLFLPYLLGERAPVWNSRASGVFLGITHVHTQDHFTRAVIEGISLALYSVATALEEASGHIEQVYASGGLVRSAIWRQVIADIFNKKVSLHNDADASSIGAALMAIKSTERLRSYPVFSTTVQPLAVSPNLQNHTRYQDIYRVFRRVYEKLKDEMAVLSEG